MKSDFAQAPALDDSALITTLSSMRDLFVENPTRAVRSKSFITLFQNYCAEELRNRGVESDGRHIRIEQKIPVERGKVEADVGVYDERDEPILIVDVRSQMSSLGKNFNNYIRMKAGEVESLHDKYPNCIVGLVYIHPDGDLPTKLPINPVGSFNFENASRQLSSLIVRKESAQKLSKYQFVSYCVVNFNTDPPALSPTTPAREELRFEQFFDNIVAALNQSQSTK